MPPSRSLSPASRKRTRASPAPAIAATTTTTKETTETTAARPHLEKDAEYEFGGPLGCLFIIVFSNALIPFFWYVLTYECYPWDDAGTSGDDGAALWQLRLAAMAPAPRHFAWFFAFFVLQVVLAATAPGFACEGLPLDRVTMEPAASVRALGIAVADRDVVRLPYLCNGYFAYYFSLALALALHHQGVFDLTVVAREWGQFAVAGQVLGNALSLFLYFYGLHTDPAPAVAVRPASRAALHPVYDFFMGTTRYPRLGIVDVKMVAEARWSWLLLIIITLSCALQAYRDTGHVSTSFVLMVVAHWLYSNATAKGEQYIITTWDMVQEKFGWMLCYWNIAGVPFSYCVASVFLLKHRYELPLPAFTALYTLLLATYFMWDTANGQKADFKAKGALRRNTFPSLPYTHLSNPATIETPYGPLLVDGWFAVASKLQYTGDIIFAFVWGASTGLNTAIAGWWIPYFYLVFFTSMIVHRFYRDERKCLAKYKEHWIEYKRRVPYAFIPGVW